MEDRFLVELPEFLKDQCDSLQNKSFNTDIDKMKLVLELCKLNVQNSGGPFAAAIFDQSKLVSVGVNQVLRMQNPILHAEILAIQLACKKLKSYDLKTSGKLELFTSGEPCMMCMGAVLWSHISRLVIAARDSDIRAIGFEEGLKPATGISALSEFGVSITQDLMRTEACEILQDYQKQGYQIYNGSLNSKSNPSSD